MTAIKTIIIMHPDDFCLDVDKSTEYDPTHMLLGRIMDVLQDAEEMGWGGDYKALHVDLIAHSQACLEAFASEG